MESTAPEDTYQVNTGNLEKFGNRKRHVQFNELVLEKILKYCQSHHDKKSFSSLRQVCKDWDIEICRILRKTQEIPISRLLSPDPRGLGWTWDPQNDDNCYFDCPYPETRSFENIKIIGTCQAIKNLQLVRFLSCEGHKIKSVHYNSNLYCGHQTKFLWDILHSWCPNLETLHLSGIQNYPCLLNTFKWEQDFNRVSHWEFNCDKIHTLILSIENTESDGDLTDCNRDIDESLTTQILNYIDSLKVIHTDIRRTSKSVCSIEEIASLSKFVDLSNENASKIQKLCKNEYRQYMPKHFLDFGILGHILTEAPIQKLMVKKLENVSHCEDFMLFLLHHPSNRRKTLKHLEFHENVHLGNNRIFGHLLCFLQSPLTTLHLDNLLPFENSLNTVYKFLKSCTDNLEHVEFGNHFKPHQDVERYKLLRIPLLPKLKILTIKSNRCFWVNAKVLLRSTPNLQKLSILENKDEPQHLKNKSVVFFCKILKKTHLDLTNTYNLTELKLAGYLCSSVVQNICNKQFCNLVKVDLSVEGSRGLEALLKGMSAEWKKLKEVKLSIGSKAYCDSLNEMVRCNYAIRDNINGLEGLQFLDINFQRWSKKFFLSVKFFGEGFSKMKSLTSLKMANFKMLLKDKQEMECCTSHIPFVCFSENEYVLHKPSYFQTSSEDASVA